MKKNVWQIWGILTVVLVIGLAGCETTGGATKAGGSAEMHYEKGKKLVEGNDIHGALNAFTKAIELDPNFTNAYFERARMKYALNFKNDAIVDFSKVIELNPKATGAYFNRGMVYIDLGNAEAYTNVFGYDTYAVSTSDASKLTKALEYFDNALSDFNKALEATNPDAQQRATVRITEVQTKKKEVETALAKEKTKEETNKFDPAKFTVIPSGFKPADYTSADLFKAVSNSKNLQRASSKEEAILNQFQAGFIPGGASYILMYVSDLTFVSQNGTDITFSSDDKAITQNMTIDQRSGLQAGQKVRVYYEVTRSPLTTWDIIAIERR